MEVVSILHESLNATVSTHQIQQSIKMLKFVPANITGHKVDKDSTYITNDSIKPILHLCNYI